MKIKLCVSEDSEIGYLSAKETRALRKLRDFLASTDLDIDGALINTSTQGWHHAAALGAQRIRHELKDSVLLDAEVDMPRMAYVIAPWVPDGVCWPRSVGGEYFHTSWKIVMRAAEPLALTEDQGDVQ